MVDQFEQQALACLKEQGIMVRSIHQWTDGCGAQYKGRYPFLDISQKSGSRPYVPIQRNFFITSHGKNVCDGLGAVVKNMAHRYVLGHHIIADPKDLMNFCEEKVAYPPRVVNKAGQIHISCREFIYIYI